jgi:predicted transcriptional regulator
MGFELWYSKKTGIRRKGTTFSELQDIFIDNITTNFIYEPLACCKTNDNIYEVKNLLKKRDFDVLGVVDENDNKIGYIKQTDLKTNSISDYLVDFSLENLISDSTPLTELIEVLAIKEYAFILKKDTVEGIVTRADINKPIVRIYLFGLISLFELHINFWIEKYYTEIEWKEILNKNRIIKANEIYNERKGNNTQLTLLECIQICDKREILLNNTEFLKIFNFSKNSFDKLLKRSEKIRNELAHSQSSIIDNLEWNKFVSTLSGIKVFLEHSELKILE